VAKLRLYTNAKRNTQKYIGVVMYRRKLIFLSGISDQMRDISISLDVINHFINFRII